MFLNNPAMYLLIILMYPFDKKTDADEIIPEFRNLICSLTMNSSSGQLTQ